MFLWSWCASSPKDSATVSHHPAYHDLSLLAILLFRSSAIRSKGSSPFRRVDKQRWEGGISTFNQMRLFSSEQLAICLEDFPPIHGLIRDEGLNVPIKP